MTKSKRHRKKASQQVAPTKTAIKHYLLLLLKYVVPTIAILSSLAVFFPRLSVEPVMTFDSTNPLQSSFLIKNDGYFECYSVAYSVDFKRLDLSGDFAFDGTGMMGSGQEIPQLCPNDSSTISIEKTATIRPNAIDSAEIYITLTYKPDKPVPIPFRFSDSFRFKTRKISSGYVWERFYKNK